MSLTFTDWENCTNDVTGQVHLLNWTADTGMGIYTHLEAIRQAIAERYATAGLTLTGILASPLPFGSIQLHTIFAAVDTAITVLIPKFVNHTDHGGDWSGQTTCAPVWTEAAVLTAIGAGSRIPHSCTVVWVKQVYAILKKLWWVKRIHISYPSKWSALSQYAVNSTISHLKTTAASTWAAAVYDYDNIASWNEVAPDTYWWAWVIAEYSPVWFQLIGGKTTYNCNVSPSVNNKNIRIYVNFSPEPWNPRLDYENVAYNRGSLEYITLYNVSLTVDTDMDVTVGDFDNFTNTSPVVGPDRTAHHWELQDIISVVEHNVPGGFTFQ